MGVKWRLWVLVSHLWETECQEDAVWFSVTIMLGRGQPGAVKGKLCV